MIEDGIFDEMEAQGFSTSQVIAVTKMLLATAEAAREKARGECLNEMAQMRASFGKLIIEAVEATEAKIFARLDEEKEREEVKKARAARKSGGTKEGARATGVKATSRTGNGARGGEGVAGSPRGARARFA